MYWEEEVLERRYKIIFDNTYLTTKEKLEMDSNYTLENLESLLECLYSNQGNDWLGRGEIYEVSIKAQIAACEVLLEEYRQKK